MEESQAEVVQRVLSTRNYFDMLGLDCFVDVCVCGTYVAALFHTTFHEANENPLGPKGNQTSLQKACYEVGAVIPDHNIYACLCRFDSAGCIQIRTSKKGQRMHSKPYKLHMRC